MMDRRRARSLLAWLLAVSIIAGNLMQGAVVQAEEPGENAGIMYYVNCGGTELPAGEVYGIYNNEAVDQPYDADSEAEYHWGYTGGSEYEIAEYEGHPVRLIQGDDAATLSYLFELPKGDYSVEVDIPYCGHWGNRVMNVDIQVGEEKTNLISNLNTTNDIESGTMKVLTSDITVAEDRQLVTVSTVRSNDGAWAPFLGYIKIGKKGAIADELIKALKEAEELYQAGNANGVYTEGSWKDFADAYEAAESLKESTDSEARAAAAGALRDAKNSLQDTSVAYNVNCGGQSLREGEYFGIYNNGAVDQPYDADSEAEYHWGYTGGSEYETPAYEGHPVRLIQGDDAATLSYLFELPKGDYSVEVDIPYCSQWGNRVMNIDVQVGEEKTNLISNLNTTNDIESGTMKVLTSDITVAEDRQLVTVSTVRSNEGAWAPFLGYIKIGIKEDEAPVEDGLVKALEEAEGIYQAGNAGGIYTEESWKNFADAYEAAEGLKDSTDSEAKKTAAETLRNAKKDLEKAPVVQEPLPITTDLMYYVNCYGTDLPDGERYGLFNNGVVDQAYNPNGSADYNWGYDSRYQYETNISTGTYAGHMVRMINGDDAATLSYYFELPKGKYNVEVDIPYCNQWGNRVMNVDVKVGEEKTNLISNLNTTNDIAEGSMKTLTSDITVTEDKQLVTVSAARSNSDAWAPFLGYIRIKIDDALLIALGNAESIYTAGNGNGRYTEESWKSFADAYDNAKNLVNSTNEADRTAAASALDLAREGLQRVQADPSDSYYYDFEEGISDADLVVNRNGISDYTGSIVYGEGRDGGKSLKTGSYGLRLNKKNLGKTYTVNAWVRSSGAISSNTSVIFLGHNNPEKWLSIAGESGQQCKIWTRADGNYQTLNEKVTVPANEWVMLTIQSDGTTTTVYKNGKVAARSTSIANALDGENQDIYLGVNFWDGQFNGFLDDVSVYKKCLSEVEVYRLYDTRDPEEILKAEGFSVPKNMTIIEGAQSQIQVTMSPAIESAEFEFSSDNDKVASIDKDGKITGVAVGTANITTTVKLGNTTKSQTTAVTVKSAEDMIDENVLYFVDCGNTGSGLMPNDKFGQCNRVTDQKLGTDPVTGKTWGWGRIGNNDPVSGTNSRANEETKEYTYQEAGSGSDFYYEFELPEGEYQVEVTVPYFLSGSNTRTFEVLASNGEIKSEFETIANNINTKKINGAAETYTGTCTSDGTAPLRLSFLGDSDAWGPIVNAIKITPIEKENPPKPPVPVTYKVTFKSAGGSAVAAKKVESGKKVAQPKNPTRSKYLFKGWYAGSKKYDFSQNVKSDLTLTAKWTKVTVAQSKVTKAQNKKAKQCAAQAKKVSGAAGYQFTYSTDKKFKKAVKSVNSKTVKATLKKLKKGKTYYVKVRAYKYDSKKQKVYGKYSAKQKVVIKK